LNGVVFSEMHDGKAPSMQHHIWQIRFKLFRV